jgi:hypothetical protein
MATMRYQRYHAPKTWSVPAPEFPLDVHERAMREHVGAKRGQLTEDAIREYVTAHLREPVDPEHVEAVVEDFKRFCDAEVT